MLYNPPRFRVDDLDGAFEIMDKNPFATVISVAEGGEPVISHLPLTPKWIQGGGGIELIGHLARANPHSKVIGTGSIHVVFHGAHAYITPKWYVHDSVPTWNYTAVHVKGRVELIETFEGLIDCLQDLSAHAERHWPSGWKFWVPEDLGEKFLPKKILGFRISIDELSFKKKLSQNRPPEEVAGVLRGLEARGDAGSLALLEDMRKLYADSGERKSE